jgi:hypothetical protein
MHRLMYNMNIYMLMSFFYEIIVKILKKEFENILW